jgi:hypothetical protein
MDPTARLRLGPATNDKAELLHERVFKDEEPRRAPRRKLTQRWTGNDLLPIFVRLKAELDVKTRLGYVKLELGRRIGILHYAECPATSVTMVNTFESKRLSAAL